MHWTSITSVKSIPAGLCSESLPKQSLFSTLVLFLNSFSKHLLKIL
jgi:hypothetical protein